ncbi:MAG: alpha-glucan family phosphorylase [Anaerolineae bacterium]
MTQDTPPLDQRRLPSRIARLRELAYNMWWSWHEEAQALYRQLDPLLWEAVNHNPVAFLRRVDDRKLDAAVHNAAYMAAYNKVFRAFDVYMGESDTWFATTYPDLKDRVIAYFSTEFGLHESLPVYAGGLGVLSGDHAKEASDLGLPFVGVGLLYYKGYFTQKINADGWQEDFYQEFDPTDRPITPVLSADGSHARIALDLGVIRFSSKVWKVQVGRVPLYLLDTLLESSDPKVTEDVTRLYGGSRTTRLLQEILLGIGGTRVLRMLGCDPQVWHLNEGHCAFLTLELVREKLAAGMGLDEAMAQVKATTVFTTHTPVPAGLDMFDLGLVAKYLSSFREELGMDEASFLDLGRYNPGWGELYSMPRLALRLSSLRNGVSELHGEVSRHLFHSIWPGRSIDDVPIQAITNGVHAETWLAPEMIALFNQYIGPDWVHYMDDPTLWSAIDAIPDEVLWETRQKLKMDLIWFLIDRAQKRWEAGETTPKHVVWSGALFGRDVLTIGFARRFATYKRATLLFHDMERLKRLMTDPLKPIQFIFAGKAHPHDDGGKRLIQEICQHALDPQLAGRIAFLEDYDMSVARCLVRGVDVWLNTPRRPREASGTSGMKAAINGVPNFSILDGWWAEGYNRHNGWAIGTEKEYEDEAYQDRLDAESLYKVLEEDVTTLYYLRSNGGLPRGWLSKVRESIKSAAPQFTTRRMIKEYAGMMYVPPLRKETLAMEPAAD